MTVFDAEFDASFVNWVAWLAEQRTFREAGLGIDASEFDLIDKRALVCFDQWVSQKYADSLKKSKES